MNHISEQDLALFAGNDLGALGRWRVNRHLRQCAECRSEVERFGESADLLAVESAAVPKGAGWDRLSAEMAANIRLGLTAGRIVDPVTAPSVSSAWRPAAVLASATVLLIAAWWLNVPHVKQHLAAQSTAQPAWLVQRAELEAGIEVTSGKSTLTLLRPRTASASVEVSTPGSLRERYVDDETGQVTINNVYAE